jgi:hypothetical protein
MPDAAAVASLANAPLLVVFPLQNICPGILCNQNADQLELVRTAFYTTHIHELLTFAYKLLIVVTLAALTVSFSPGFS